MTQQYIKLNTRAKEIQQLKLGGLTKDTASGHSPLIYRYNLRIISKQYAHLQTMT